MCLALAAIAAAGTSADARDTRPLQTKGRAIVDGAGRPVLLRGFNLGGLFVMEPFMTPMDASHTLSDTASVIKALTDRFGPEQARGLIDTYERNWINDADIAEIAHAGFNTVRIPVWWGQFLDFDNPTQAGFRADGFAALDRVVAACRAHGIVAIIDMHGVIGGQSNNPDTGKANQNRFWSDPVAQANTAWLWGRIAAHYRDNPAVAGYDLINEPAPPKGVTKEDVWAIYDRLYRTVRAADPAHMVFIEDTFGSWSLDMLPDPRQFGWTNVVYEGHVYPWPRNNPGLPPHVAATRTAERAVRDYAAHAAWNIPGYIGEFNGLDTVPGALATMTTQFDRVALGWTAWTYKASNAGRSLNYWGFIEPKGLLTRPDPSRDDAHTIAEDWAQWRTSERFVVNPAFR